MMKKLSLALLIASALMLWTPACKKSGGGGTDEVNLVVETTPATGANEAPAPGPDFPLKVDIKSTMPPSGVKIEVSAKIDGSTAAPFFTSSQNTTSASNNNFTITNTPKTVVCVVDIKVTSISKPTNIWTGSYKYSKK